jgi:propionate CoA-transferase
MALKKVISVEDAIAIVHDGDVLATTGYGGNGTPDYLMRTLERRFLETGAPRGLTLVWAGGQGDAKEKGLNYLGHEGLVRRAIGGHYGLIPKLEQLAVQNKIEAYNLPEGVIVHLYRDIAARKPGTLSKVGLGTFVDPRIEGGRMNEVTREDIVRLVEFDGEESLFFKAFPLNVVFIRGTTADPNGNVTMERESLVLENLALAMAAKNSGGYVICQVERVAAEGSLDSRQVRIPGILVDCVVQADPEHHMQTYGTQYNPAYSGEVNIPLAAIQPLPHDERKIIARRAALELSPNSVVTLGVGLPDAIGAVIGEERLQDLVTPVLDPGVIGGVPMGGLDFGAVVNKQAAIDHCSAFDLVDGGGLDAAFLGFAECDRHGNINASRFAKRIAGCGGFINISQNTRKVIFVGTFSSGGLEVAIEDGRLRIVKEGRFFKFVDAVGQITFSGRYAAQRGQDVLYVTERCVFRLATDGLHLVEVAPGMDVERDVLRHLPFRPFVGEVAEMDATLFVKRPMGLRGRMLDIHIDKRVSYDAASNTLYLNYAGMRVRSEQDIRDILEAVEKVLKPLGRRVNAIVNYDRFEADDEVRDAYLDAVRYIEANYYLKVSRYTNSGFLRIVFGSELERRKVSSRLFTSIDEARRNLAEGR